MVHARQARLGQLGDACPFQAPLNATIRLGVGELGKAMGGCWEELVGELTVQALADNAWEYLGKKEREVEGEVEREEDLY